MKCLKCGWSNSDTAAYCQNCHAYLAEQPGMESIDAIKALILSLFFTGIFYLIGPELLTKLPPLEKNQKQGPKHKGNNSF